MLLRLLCAAMISVAAVSCGEETGSEPAPGDGGTTVDAAPHVDSTGRDDSASGCPWPLEGAYRVSPEVLFKCGLIESGITVTWVELQVVTFINRDNRLDAEGLVGPGRALLTQSPAPTACDFYLSIVVSSACSETFVLRGSMVGRDWEGTLDLTFDGEQCSALDCDDQSIDLTGRRIHD